MQHEQQQIIIIKKHIYFKNPSLNKTAARGFVAKIMCFGGCLTACQLFMIRQKKGRCIAFFAGTALAVFTGTGLVRKAAADTPSRLEYESSDIHMFREV